MRIVAYVKVNIMKRAVFVLCGVAVMAGCMVSPFYRDKMAVRAQSELVGMSKAAVLACAGPPKAQAQDGSVDVWTYEVRNHVIYCQANILFRSGVVQSINYVGTGMTGGWLKPGELCMYALENCLKR